jgi:TonB-linked SusC/RagA family outer membrane protein
MSNFPGTLPGRLAGLTAMQLSNEPGYEDIKLISRGVNTFGFGGSDILILVDGFVEANFSSLSPQEVESVTLLKDAAATAMYGSRGANGVLLVTTKRGREGPLRVNFSTQYGFQNATNLPKFLGAHDYARLYNEALINDGREALYSESEIDLYRTGNDPYMYPDVDWYNELLRNTSPLAKYDLNFSGGLPNVRYFVMLNQTNNDLLYKRTGDDNDFSVNSNYRRTNFRSNIDLDLTRTLRAKISFGGMVEDKANPAGSTTYGILNTISKIPPNNFPVNTPNGLWARSPLYQNPLGLITESGWVESNARTLQANIGLTQQLNMITEGLSITGRAAFNSWFRGFSSKSRSFRSFVLDREEGEYIYIPYGIDTSLSGAEGESEQYRNYAFQGIANYDRTFGDHMVSGLILGNMDEYVIGGVAFPFRHLNFSGRATYAYDQKYIGEISFGYMGSENFARDNRFGFFPAVSLGWIVSNEEFLNDNNVLNYLKIRGSYGLVGNNNIGGPRFIFDQYYPYTSNYYLGTGNNAYASLIQGRPANPSVTWEKERSLNIGFEATLFDRFDLVFDVFNRDRYDILVIPEITDPDFMGYIKPYLNEGEANSRGFEARTRYSSDATRDFSFFIEGNFWYHQNERVSSSEGLQLRDYLYRDGQPIGQPFGLVAVGYFRDQNDIDSSPRQYWESVRPGDVKYQDQNGDGIIDENDLYPIGNTSIPTLSAGIHMGSRFRGFDFDVFLQGVTGRTVLFAGDLFHAFQNDANIGEIALGRWTPATAETASYPRLSSQNNENNYRYSTLWQRDGSFLKVRSIQLGYTLPENVISSAGMESARIFINGTNLLSFDHMEGYRDPEIGYGYPATRSISFGIRVQFR